MSDQEDRLAQAIRSLLPRLAGGERRARPDEADIPARLDYLEQEIHETRSRVNTLFFAVIAVGLGNLVGRVVTG